MLGIWPTGSFRRCSELCERSPSRPAVSVGPPRLDLFQEPFARQAGLMTRDPQGGLSLATVLACWFAVGALHHSLQISKHPTPSLPPSRTNNGPFRQMPRGPKTEHPTPSLPPSRAKRETGGPRRTRVRPRGARGSKPEGSQRGPKTALTITERGYTTVQCLDALVTRPSYIR